MHKGRLDGSQVLWKRKGAAYIFNAVPNDHVAPRTRWPKDLISHLLIALGLDFGQRCAAPDQIDGDTEAFPLLQCRVCFA